MIRDSRHWYSLSGHWGGNMASAYPPYLAGGQEARELDHDDAGCPRRDAALGPGDAGPGGERGVFDLIAVDPIDEDGAGGAVRLDGMSKRDAARGDGLQLNL